MPCATATAKKQPLTLEQISKYDDVCTDALVDQTFYSSTIPKNRTTYHPSRGIREEQVTKIIQNHLIVDPDLPLAEEKLLALEGLRKFHNALRTEKEKDDFRRHLRRYAQTYLPDCPFEVSTTNRYTIVTYEAAVTARHFIKKGDSIKYLSGIQVLITPKEEEDMTKRKKDFSIVVSSRNKCASLFMGPARFANHDCDANARLVITSQSTIEIFAKKNIEVGDEITVTYGENYFGEDNCECLCQTCERNLANGWSRPDGEDAMAGPAGPVKKSIEESIDEGYSLRRRRRDDSTARSSRTPSRTPDIRPRVSRSRTKTLLRVDSYRASQTGSPAPETLLRQKRKHEFAVLSSPPVTPAKRQKTTLLDDQPVPLPEGILQRDSEGESSSDAVGSAAESSAGDSVITDLTTPDEEIKEPELSLQSPKPTPTKSLAPGLTTGDASLTVSDVASSLESENTMMVQPLPAAEVASGAAMAPATTGIPAPDVPQRVSGVDFIAPEELDLIVIPPPLTPASKMNEHEPHTPGSAQPESTGEPIKRGRGRPKGSTKAKKLADFTAANPSTNVTPTRKATSTPRKARSPPPPMSDDDSVDDTDMPRNVRRPGDYTLTPLLLSEPDTAWIHCTICNDAFVQRDAYFTRSACPRCERHSKLYGYQWPKTQKVDKKDKEERILDHREIHRFLDPEDEARIRGRKYPWASSKENEEEEKDTSMPKSSSKARQTKIGAQGKQASSRKSTDHQGLASAEGSRRSGRARTVSRRGQYAAI
ncbi:hypothetical protein JX266_005805 [Neoarthrinium moseri]|nr:hypothetical protein JX266_005805 [Neoarthrinium moseri]